MNLVAIMSQGHYCKKVPGEFQVQYTDRYTASLGQANRVASTY